jgi:hypothetical protein
MPELSDEARAVLRDFILVFDLDDFFKGSTVISDDNAAEALHYMQSMFESAGIPAPSAHMTDKALAIRAKALRGSNHKFKKEHAKFHELIKFAFELCNVNTEKIKSKSAEMRDVWTNDWKLDLHSDDTKEYVQELIDLRAGLANLRGSRLASLRNKTQAKEEKAPVKMPRWLRLFQSMFFSIRHHSQTTEEVFKHVDDLRNCTNLGMDRAASRVLCRMNIIQPDLHAARSQHTPVTGRTSKEKKTEEKRASLKRTSVTCKRITEMALASAAKNYTRQGMEAVRSARRPEAITNRKRETDTFQAKVDADLKHWGKKQRTVDEEKLAATAATTPLVKKKKDDGKHPLEGKINAVKAVFTERQLTHVTHTQAANGQKAKVLTGDDLMKAVNEYLDGIEEEERTAIINDCCDKHEEASSARATKKAKASSGVEASTSSGAPS